jgi:hypothetical protein
MEHYKGRELDAVGGKESDGRLEFKKTRDQDYQHYSYQPFWFNSMDNVDLAKNLVSKL